jgi:AcrR family transcriptional regulator
MSRRAGLDRAAVVRAAAALADAGPAGLAGLSLARLAQSLGVKPPSLYKHVDGLPALHRELARLGVSALGDRLAEAAVGRSGADAIRGIASAYRSYAHQHPGLYTASLRAPDPNDSAWQEAGERAVTIMLRVLEAYDLRGEDALHAVRAFRSLAHGFVSLEAADGFGLPLDLDESYRRLVETYIEGLQGKVPA